MKALEKERISPYISQLYECGINDSDIKLVVDQFRADVSCSSSLFLLRDDDKSDGIKLFSSGLTEAQQQFYLQHHRQDVWFNHYLDKGCKGIVSANSMYRSSYHLTPASNRCLVYATLVRTSFGINFRPFLNML